MTSHEVSKLSQLAGHASSVKYIKGEMQYAIARRIQLTTCTVKLRMTCTYEIFLMCVELT